MSFIRIREYNYEKGIVGFWKWAVHLIKISGSPNMFFF